MDCGAEGRSVDAVRHRGAALLRAALAAAGRRGDGAVADGEADLRHAAIRLSLVGLLAAPALPARPHRAAADREAPLLRADDPPQHRPAGRAAGGPERQLAGARADG